jgi:hypothetical protein
MDQERELQRHDRQHDPTRVLTSDGGFAIVITLEAQGVWGSSDG